MWCGTCDLVVIDFGVWRCGESAEKGARLGEKQFIVLITVEVKADVNLRLNMVKGGSWRRAAWLDVFEWELGQCFCDVSW